MADHTLSLQTRNRTFHPVLSLSFGHPTKPIPGECRSYYSALTDDGEEKQSPSCRPDRTDLHTSGTQAGPKTESRPEHGTTSFRASSLSPSNNPFPRTLPHMPLFPVYFSSEDSEYDFEFAVIFSLQQKQSESERF
jgi:hypothetical protein